MSIKFHQHFVLNTNNGMKCRVYYHQYLPDDRGGERLVISAKDQLEKLRPVFGDAAEVINNTDIMTDYFEKDRVFLDPDHPLYVAARTAARRRVEAVYARSNSLSAGRVR